MTLSQNRRMILLISTGKLIPCHHHKLDSHWFATWAIPVKSYSSPPPPHRPPWTPLPPMRELCIHITPLVKWSAVLYETLNKTQMPIFCYHNHKFIFFLISNIFSNIKIHIFFISDINFLTWKISDIVKSISFYIRKLFFDLRNQHWSPVWRPR